MSLAWAIQEEMGAHARRSRRSQALHVAGAQGLRDAMEKPRVVRMPHAGREAGPTYEAIVALVRCYVVAHIGRHLEIDEIVAASGVSASTVRRAILSQTGKQLARFVLGIRLDQARAWLSTNRESRNIEQIAAALGFKRSAVLSRNYRQRFGETMGETRRRAAMKSESRSE